MRQPGDCRGRREHDRRVLEWPPRLGLSPHVRRQSLVARAQPSIRTVIIAPAPGGVKAVSGRGQEDMH